MGRLHFDNVSGYIDYVTSLIDYETSQAVPNNGETVIFATRHPFDRATQFSADQLVNRLADGVTAERGQSRQPGVAQHYKRKFEF